MHYKGRMRLPLGRWIQIGTIVFILALAAVLVAGWGRSFGRQNVSCTLKDGSVVTFRSCTVGTNHVMRYDRRIQDLLADLLPAAWRSHVGAHVQNLMTPSPSLAVWVVRHGGTNDQLRLLLRDEHGCSFGDASTTTMDVQSNHFLGVAFPSYPRQGGPLTLEIDTMCQYEWALAGTLSVPNPVRAVPATWPEAPRSQTNLAEGCQFVLCSLETGISPTTSPKRASQPGEPSGALVTFQVLKDQQPCSGWKFCGITSLSDTTGNNAPVRGWGGHLSQPNGFQEVGFETSLCHRERSWKIQVAFARETGFATEDLWTVTNIMVPKDGASTQIQQQKTIHGATVTVEMLAGRKARIGGRLTVNEERPTLRIRCDKLGEEYKLRLAKMADPQGRAITESGYSSSGDDYVYNLNIPVDVQTMDLTIAVTKRLLMDFEVEPQPFVEK